jgi:uridylate kinase
MAKKEVMIISVGGSVVVPDAIDAEFLQSFRSAVKDYLNKYKFVLIVGGGKTARNYQNSARELGDLHNEDLDWIGIHATRLNAQLLKSIFRDVAYPKVIKDPTQKVNFDNVLIAAGWKPGFSTDYDAVVLAEVLGAKTVVNMTNIDYLYTKNPKEHKDAVRILSIDWKGFQKIVGTKWSPGLNVPFDPIATKKAKQLGLKLILIGKNASNFRNFLAGRKFKGSVVE